MSLTDNEFIIHKMIFPTCDSKSDNTLITCKILKQIELNMLRLLMFGKLDTRQTRKIRFHDLRDLIISKNHI